MLRTDIMKLVLLLQVSMSYIASVSALVCHQCRREEIGKYTGETTVEEHRCRNYEDLGQNMTCSDKREYCFFEYKYQKRNSLLWKGCKIPSDYVDYKTTEDGKQMCKDEYENAKSRYVVGSICFCKTDLCNNNAVKINNFITSILAFICVSVTIFS